MIIAVSKTEKEIAKCSPIKPTASLHLFDVAINRVKLYAVDECLPSVEVKRLSFARISLIVIEGLGSVVLKSSKL